MTNRFQSFALSDNALHEESPVRVTNASAKRRAKILLSDDEDEDATQSPVKRTQSSTASSPWLESRNPISLSPAQKQANINAAISQRKGMIPKKSIPGFNAERVTDDEDDANQPRQAKPGVMSKIFSKSTLIKDSLLNKALDDDFDPLHDFRMKATKQREIERENRAQQRSAPVETTKKRMRLSESDEDSEKPAMKTVDMTRDDSPEKATKKSESRKEREREKEKEKEKEKKAKKKKRSLLDEDEGERDRESSDDGGWRDELTAEDLKSKANEVLRQCERVSANLRNSLKKWKGADTRAIVTQSTQASQGEREGEDCVNLMSITATAADKAVLTDNDIATVCPSLRLNNYQLVGVNWMRLLHENKVNGVLADDMGLGKTVQTIAFLGWLQKYRQENPREHAHRPHLIVVPASVLANWENEFDKFCPTLQIVKYHGSQAERVQLRHELRRMIEDQEVDVVLCTYTIFEREACKADRGFIYAQRFDFLVLDEAHCIKNAESSRYANLNAIHTQHRLLLSGTPVQNNLSELLAMLSFLMPAVFGREDCALMMEAFGWTKSGGAAPSSKNGLSLAQLKGMLAPFVLRRLKRDVLDQLTDKRAELRLLEMSAVQSKIYRGIIERYAHRKAGAATLARSKINSLAKKKRLAEGDTASGKIDVIDLCDEDDDKEKDTAEEFSAEQVLDTFSGSEAKHLFTALRKAANHPLLLRVHYTDDKVIRRIAQVAYDNGYFGEQCAFDRVMAEMEIFSDYDIHQLCLQYETLLGKYQLSAETLYDSPKMNCLRELLPRLMSEGHRMLLFSQWTRLLDLLEILLNDMGLSFLRLDGSTPIAERQELIDRYSTDHSIAVFLLSTKAGGLGINLTAADTVILHDLDFNPENDKQAEDRCHRIGQTKPVTVYRLVCAETVDEDIYEMGERKRELSQAVLSDHRDESKKKSAHAKDDEDLNLISKILSKALSGKR